MSFRDGDLNCEADIAMVTAFKTVNEVKWIGSIRSYWEEISRKSDGWSCHLDFCRVWREFGESRIPGLTEIEFFEAAREKFTEEYPEWMGEYAQLQLRLASRCWRKEISRQTLSPVETLALAYFRERNESLKGLQQCLKERIDFFNSL